MSVVELWSKARRVADDRAPPLEYRGDDQFNAALSWMRGLEPGDTFDFDSLRPSERQAALTLLREKLAELVVFGGRLRVQRRERNDLVRALTFGLRG